MSENYFLYCSTDDDCNSLWWLQGKGWIEDETKATRYNKSILTPITPLPKETGAIVEKTPAGEDVHFYGIIEHPHPLKGMIWFEVDERSSDDIAYLL